MARHYSQKTSGSSLNYFHPGWSESWFISFDLFFLLHCTHAARRLQRIGGRERLQLWALLEAIYLIISRALVTWFFLCRWQSRSNRLIITTQVRFTQLIWLFNVQWCNTKRSFGSWLFFTALGFSFFKFLANWIQNSRRSLLRLLNTSFCDSELAFQSIFPLF